MRKLLIPSTVLINVKEQSSGGGYSRHVASFRVPKEMWVVTLNVTTDDEWKYHRYNLNEPVADFPHFESLWELWQTRRSDDKLPAWRDFDIYDFHDWYGFLIVYDVLDDPFDLKYRLFGSEIVNLYQTEYTGKTIRENGFEIEDEADIAHFEGLFNECKIGASTGPIYWDNRHWRHLTFLDLPLADDGDTITHFLTAIHEIK
jgi:hypothetical protein